MQPPHGPDTNWWRDYITLGHTALTDPHSTLGGLGAQTRFFLSLLFFQFMRAGLLTSTP